MLLSVNPSRKYALVDRRKLISGSGPPPFMQSLGRAALGSEAGREESRGYISSTTGPAIALTTSPKAHVITNAAVE